MNTKSIIYILFFILLYSYKVEAQGIQAKAYLVFDYKTGIVLSYKNPNKKLKIASITKLMTAYTVLKAIREKRLKYTDKVRISLQADKTGGSSLGLRQNTSITVKRLLQGLIVRSGNDAAVALAEKVAKTESKFVKKMNAYARQLGMKNSLFVNSSGLPSRKKQYSTVRDVGLLAQRIVSEFPKAYRNIFSLRSYNKQHNRNKLVLDGYADGLKTGYTRKAGFCLVASRKEKNTRLITILLGSKTTKKRNTDVRSLLKSGFKHVKKRLLKNKNLSFNLINLNKALGRYQVISENGVYIRQQATTKSKRLGSLLDGQKITVIDSTNQWKKVQYRTQGKNKQGYVFSRYLKKIN